MVEHINPHLSNPRLLRSGLHGSREGALQFHLLWLMEGTF
jgi:hypothetical protein